jgi:zinc protease
VNSGGKRGQLRRAEARADPAIVSRAAPYNFLMGTALPTPTTAAGLHEEVLDNGLRVLIKEVHTAPLASVWCWYKVGSKHEMPGITGVSHWVEHMNFKGTANIPRDKVKGIIEKHGGYWNGYTWIDQTTYTETASRDALDHMLFIEAERMSSCLYDPADCESERTVIISELQGGENDPDTLLDQELTATAFRAHPYRHPTIGWLADLERMGREDLYGYYRQHYQPNNATLVIVGDVDAADAMRAVVRRFGSIPRGERRSHVFTPEPPQLGERRVKVAREGTTAYLKVGYHAPAANDRDFFPMLVLDAILTGAKGLNLWASFRTPPPQRSARLYQALVNTGLASAVNGGLVPTAEPFLYTISATANSGVSLQALEDATLAEIDRIRTGGVTPQELRKAKTQLKARSVFESDSISNIGHQLGYFETIASWRDYLAIPERLDAVTLEDISAAAAARLTAANRTVGWFEPLEPGQDASLAPVVGASAGPASI